jgi:hypothetical protein
MARDNDTGVIEVNLLAPPGEIRKNEQSGSGLRLFQRRRERRQASSTAAKDRAQPRRDEEDGPD